MRWIDAAGARLRLLFGRRAAESRMDEEIGFHVEMETERIMRATGVGRAEARRRALVAFGGVAKHKEALRDGRGLAWLGGLSLDVKLGLRMLAKYPGLSLVSVGGMAVAIAIGAGAFGFLGAMLDPTLPLHEGEQVVALQNADARRPGNPDRQALPDFALWRGRLTTVRDVGAYTADSRTLVAPNGTPDLVPIAHMTASGFRVARVAPAMGRYFNDEDEREGAPPVLVVAHEEWQKRFGGDTGIVGRSVRLGSAWYTIVGVMPAGFRFPLYYGYWAPLRLDPADYEPGTGPELHIFGRLAPGATLKQAQAEIAAVGAAGGAARRPHLRPQVLRYAHSYFDLDTPAMAMVLQAIRVAVSLLLVVVAVNVSALVYARTAARAGEIAVRTALGASRRRVVGQLFAEALVLSGLAAVIGLTITRVAQALVLSYQARVSDADFPFWMDFGLSPSAVAYTVVLALLAGVIVGVVPALKATRRDVQAGLQQLSARGSRMQLGRTWTALIVAQVAVAVAVLPYASYIAGQSLSRGSAAPAFPVHEILRAQVALERLEAAPPAQAAAYDSAMSALFLRRAEELVRRLEAEPGVAGVTFASRFPGEEGGNGIEVEGGETGGAQTSRVDVGMLDVLGVSMLAGRGLAPSDLRAAAPGAPNATEAAGAVVNGPFAEWMRTSGAVLGRRVRIVRRSKDAAGEERIEKGPWIEVVGVMPDFVVPADWEQTAKKLYLPASLAGVVGGGRSVSLAVRVRGATASAFAPRFREVAAAVDPALQLHDLQTAADLQWESQQALRLTGIAVAVATLSVLLLSAAGIYAMMSFTVARRRREIGIRAALGANARHVLRGIFARAGAQVGAGVLVGIVLAAAINQAAGGVLPLGLLPLAAALMLVIGLLAAFGPARQGLAVQPTEALREE